MKSEEKKSISIGSRNILIINCFLIVSTLLHYFTPIMLEEFHGIFRRLYYIPIILGSFWFGFRGGVVVSVVSALLYAPHLFLQWRESGLVRVEQYLEIVMYVAVGIVTGIMADNEKSQRLKAEEVSRELELSYDKLHEQAREIFEKEQQLMRADRLSTTGELAASLAHEIRNPLGAILGSVEILKDNIGSDSKEYEFLDIMISEVNRLNGVINNFLSFSKASRPVMEKFNINDAVSDIKSLVELGTGKKEIHFLTSLDSDAGYVDGDEGQIKQAFLNVLLNSVQVLGDHGNLKIETHKGKKAISKDDYDVSFSAGKIPGDECVSIIFSDNGKGISAENIKNIFDPFYTTRENGTGLGLSITKRIIENHGGGIDIYSAKDKGTTFVIFLPVK